MICNKTPNDLMFVLLDICYAMTGDDARNILPCNGTTEHNAGGKAEQECRTLSGIVKRART